MIRKRSARALAGGLAVILLLAAASAAYAAVTGTFSGKTKQKQAISFHVGHGHVTQLDFHIRDTCPSGHMYAVHDFNFPAIKINKSHKFDQRFSNKGLNARAEIKGTIFKQQGHRQHRRRPRHRQGAPLLLRQHHVLRSTSSSRLIANRRLHGGGSFARPARRYYDAGSERMACGPPKHQQIL